MLYTSYHRALDSPGKARSTMKNVFFILVVACMTAWVFAADPVQFSDPNLKSIVEKTLGVTDPTPDDMLKLTRLYAGDQGISSIGGLQHATNLTSLCLHRNNITDITPVAGLTRLTYFCIHDNAVEDVAPVRNLTALLNLLLYNNRITDLSPVAGLTELTSLYANNNRLTDLTPLANLKKLRFLDASNNQITDVTPLSGLAELTECRVTGNRIADLAPLARLERLSSVWAFENPAPIPARWIDAELSVYLDGTQYAKFAPNAPKGKLTCRGDTDSFMINRSNCFIRIKADAAGIDLPAGEYRLAGWEIEKKAEDNALWKMTAVSRTEGKGIFTVTDAQTTTLDVGEPVVAVVTAAKGRSGYSFSQAITGRMGESISILRGGLCPAPPRLNIRNKDGTYDKTFNFEYG